MEFTVKLNGTILDFRQLAITIAALFGGFYSAVVTGIIMSLMRLMAFGTLSPATIFSASNTLLMSIMLGLICTRNLSYWKKWTIPSLIYLIMMTLGGIFTAYLTQFLIKAKTHFLMIEKAATFDFLTELNNHRTFDEAFNSLLLDTVLKQLGKLLKDVSRSFDIVSRIGGEEFAILLYDCPHKHALLIGERIRMAVKNQDFLLNEGKVIQITVSVGVATYPDTNGNTKKKRIRRCIKPNPAVGIWFVRILSA
ncbi:GGDEF domain-containing protein [Paenibacillus alginolyticus]|uniref:Diguanylate cyclase n=1 Tax=Paenibacillus alginolyticus TaxID=59839 RepID=A0ABT4GG51_9BACL|nr:diguanylate cyclase [Paenibacillus alginolyticus]MCY9695167.1 diguanylate cyclase [Paenibacillus alginolyticus]MEC0143102.1 diguanylate cyclase [Paenibacillus alginolyticus]